MQIASTYVGTELEPYHTVIDWRYTTNYAAAVGDANPCYFDDTRSEGLIAHPVFPVAVTWPVSYDLVNRLQAVSFPVDLLVTQVHHTEHIVLHRPVRPGMSLTISGIVAAILPHRAGTRLILRYDAVEDDVLVFTEFIGGLMRGVSCTDEGRSLYRNPEDSPLDPDGSFLWERPVVIDPLLTYLYDGCSDIVFPIHTSPAFARSVGLPGIIVQGTATLALAVRELVASELEGRPEQVRELSCRFAGMVFPGSRLTVRLLQRNAEEERVTLIFDMADEKGLPVLRSGRLVYDRTEGK